ncbi:MAG: hypothetical protein HRT67_06060 [Flavobacteriaceae bacterium]|nr:hypothetical protein [Flavobacteriaceae bacterium]
MITTVIDASIHTLSQSIYLLAQLTNKQLSNRSIPPYYSCIGAHIRHILDVYDCVLEGLKTKCIDLTLRRRDERMNLDTAYATVKVKLTISKLQAIDLNVMPQTGYILRDDLGLGVIEMSYTLDAALSQANSHAIHHFAIINYLLDRLDIGFENADFGYNPTSPRNDSINETS